MIFTIYTANASVCCALSYVLNSALAYCVRRHTRAEMRDYAALMLLTCGLDVLLSTLDVVCLMVSGRSSQFRYYTFNGPVGVWLAAHTWLSPQILTYTYLFLALILPSWGTIQFFLRYLIVCRQRHFSGWICLGLTAASSLSVGLLLINIGRMNDPSQYRDPALIAAVAENFLIPASDVRFSVVMPTDSPLYLFNMYFFRGYTVFLFMLMCACGWRILRFSSRGPNQKSFARQVSLTLTIQGVLPFYTLIISLASFTVTSLQGSYPQLARWFFSLSMLPNAWLPVLNPLITLLVIRAYRRGVVHLLAGWAIGAADGMHAISHGHWPCCGGADVDVAPSASDGGFVRSAPPSIKITHIDVASGGTLASGDRSGGRGLIFVTNIPRRTR